MALGLKWIQMKSKREDMKIKEEKETSVQYFRSTKLMKLDEFLLYSSHGRMTPARIFS